MNLESIQAVLGGAAGQWIGALAIASTLILLCLLAKTVLLRKLREMAGHSATSIDDAGIRMIEATRVSLIVVLALYAGSHNLGLPTRVFKVLDTAAVVALFLQIGLWLAALVAFWINRSRTRAMASNVGDATSLSAMSFIAQLVLWALVTLLMLDNLGVNITALVAGLGIGGIAVALAVQNILGDLFASLSIVTDKPFVIGDAIAIDNFQGTVENVGLKTTRIRSLTGELIVFSNSDLLKARLRNYRNMSQRRVQFTFDVLYQTSPDKLEKIPAMVRSLIDARERVRFDRAHLLTMTENTLRFEVVYWVLSPDYQLYADTQQAINLGLLRGLAAAGVEFAYSSNYARPAAAG